MKTIKILKTEIVNGQKVEEHLVDRGNHVSYVTYVSGCEYPGKFDVAVAKLRDGTFPQKRAKSVNIDEIQQIVRDLVYGIVCPANSTNYSAGWSLGYQDACDDFLEKLEELK